jgi:hypothetical protein
MITSGRRFRDKTSAEGLEHWKRSVAVIVVNGSCGYRMKRILAASGDDYTAEGAAVQETPPSCRADRCHRRRSATALKLRDLKAKGLSTRAR